MDFSPKPIEGQKPSAGWDSNLTSAKLKIHSSEDLPDPFRAIRILYPKDGPAENKPTVGWLKSLQWVPLKVGQGYVLANIQDIVQRTGISWSEVRKQSENTEAFAEKVKRELTQTTTLARTILREHLKRNLISSAQQYSNSESLSTIPARVYKPDGTWSVIHFDRELLANKLKRSEKEIDRLATEGRLEAVVDAHPNEIGLGGGCYKVSITTSSGTQLSTEQLLTMVADARAKIQRAAKMPTPRQI